MVEYCRFGNLHTYLINHRSRFRNQLDPQFSDQIEFAEINNYPKLDRYVQTIIMCYSLTITTRLRSSGYLKPYGALNKEELPLESSYDDIVLLPDASFGTKRQFLRLNSMGQSASYRCDEVSQRINNLKPSENQQGWIWYQGDDEQLKSSISTRDLIYWSVQIARGMDYLVSKKVFHILF